LQIGFDYRDGFDYVVIPSHKIPGSTNVGIAGRWVFQAINNHGTKFIFTVRVQAKIKKTELIVVVTLSRLLPSNFRNFWQMFAKGHSQLDGV